MVNGEHTLEQLWQMSGGCDLVSIGNGFSTDFPDVNILIIPFADNPSSRIYKGSTEPFRGWSAPEYNVLEPASELSFIQKGYDRIVFDVMLLPYKGTPDRGPSVSIEKKEDGSTVSYMIKIDDKVSAVKADHFGWRMA